MQPLSRWPFVALAASLLLVFGAPLVLFSVVGESAWRANQLWSWLVLAVLVELLGTWLAAITVSAVRESGVTNAAMRAALVAAKWTRLLGLVMMILGSVAALFFLVVAMSTGFA